MSLRRLMMALALALALTAVSWFVFDRDWIFDLAFGFFPVLVGLAISRISDGSSHTQGSDNS